MTFSHGRVAFAPKSRCAQKKSLTVGTWISVTQSDGGSLPSADRLFGLTTSDRTSLSLSSFYHHPCSWLSSTRRLTCFSTYPIHLSFVPITAGSSTRESTHSHRENGILAPFCVLYHLAKRTEHPWEAHSGTADISLCPLSGFKLITRKSYRLRRPAAHNHID
jgi:hypothetical protein